MIFARIQRNFPFVFLIVWVLRESRDVQRAVARYLRGKTITDRISTGPPQREACKQNMDEGPGVTVIDPAPQERVSSFVNKKRSSVAASSLDQLHSSLSLDSLKRDWKPPIGININTGDGLISTHRTSPLWLINSPNISFAWIIAGFTCYSQKNMLKQYRQHRFKLHEYNIGHFKDSHGK